jgi:hypothetical protein
MPSLILATLGHQKNLTKFQRLTLNSNLFKEDHKHLLKTTVTQSAVVLVVLNQRKKMTIQKITKFQILDQTMILQELQQVSKQLKTQLVTPGL